MGRGCVKTLFCRVLAEHCWPGTCPLQFLFLVAGPASLSDPGRRVPSREASFLDGLHQPPDTDQRHHPLDVVGQHMQCHLAAHVTEPPRQEMGVPHPSLDRAEGVLDRAAAQGHRIRITTEPLDGRVDQVLVLPPRDSALGAGGASAVDGTSLATVDPISSDLNAALFAGAAIGQLLAGRAEIDIALGVVAEVGLHIHPLAALPDVAGRGTVVVIPASWQARISGPLK